MFREQVLRWKIKISWKLLRGFRFKLCHLFLNCVSGKFSNSKCRRSFNSLIHISSMSFPSSRFFHWIPSFHWSFEIFIRFLSGFHLFRLFDIFVHIFNFIQHLKLSQNFISTQFSITWNPFVRSQFFSKNCKDFSSLAYHFVLSLLFDLFSQRPQSNWQ